MELFLFHTQHTDFMPWLSCLPACEQEETMAIKPENRRQQHLAGRLFLFSRVSEKTGCPVKNLRLEKGPHGKPLFADWPDIHFSLSYTADIFALALHSAPIGIDIEQVRDRKLFSGKSMTTASEKKHLSEAPEPLLAFYELWTRKEAYTKYLGNGLTMSLASFDVWQAPAAGLLSTYFTDGCCISLCSPAGNLSSGSLKRCTGPELAALFDPTLTG